MAPQILANMTTAELARRARKVGGPPSFLDWLAAQATARAAWDECPDPVWLLCLSGTLGLGTHIVVSAVAQVMPRASDFACDSEFLDIAEIAARLVDVYAAGGTPDALADAVRLTLRPQLIEWNVHTQYPSGQTPEGVPPAPAPERRPLVAAANAAYRLHTAAEADEVGWRGPLVLVLKWCIHEAAQDAPGVATKLGSAIEALGSRPPPHKRA
jgi:hypothetical protein